VTPRLVIRTLGHDERRGAARLAALDDRRLPGGTLLGAEVDGELWAAVAIETGEGVADPFRPSGGILATLEATATSLRGGNARRRARRAGAPRVGRRYLTRGGATALQQVHRAPA
jgi:hypothetical protein